MTGAARHLVEAGDDLNALALRGCLRFHDPELVMVLTHRRLQLLVLLRAVERQRHKVEVLVPVESLHARVAIV